MADFLQANSAKGEPIKGDWNGGVYGAVVLQNARQRGYVPHNIVDSNYR